MPVKSIISSLTIRDSPSVCCNVPKTTMNSSLSVTIVLYSVAEWQLEEEEEEEEEELLYSAIPCKYLRARGTG